MPAAPPHQALTPEASRIVTLDLYRGFALVGVLLANLLVFAYPVQLYVPLASPGLSLSDRVIEGLIRIFVVGSFYPLFSFLFGLGVARQLAKGAAAIPLYRRRLWGLLLIGLLHAVFIWSGDILTTYAVIGFLLIPWWQQPSRTMLRWMMVLTLLSLVIFGQPADHSNALSPERAQAVAQIYAQGSYLAVTQQRFAELGLSLLSLPFYLPQLLSLFLLGLLCGKARLLEQAYRHSRLGQRVLVVSLLLSLPIMILAARALLKPELATDLLTSLDRVIGSPALGFAYLSGLTLLLRRAKWQRRLRPLAAVGQMALTHYLLQSVVMSLLFYGYGGGWYGQLPLGWGLVTALSLFVLQLFISNWWLERFHYGPTEWLWRCFSYRQWLPFRRGG